MDRGAGMNAAMSERALASSGELRGRSNIGKGQIKAADYVLVPDLIAQAPLVALNAVEEGGFFRRLWDSLWMWWESA